ncbi:MAG: class B sortase [Oscillospiraceae bacterium]|nr:class B sortase [Oscillospiraceae bacterium]
MKSRKTAYLIISFAICTALSVLAACATSDVVVETPETIATLPLDTEPEPIQTEEPPPPPEILPKYEEWLERNEDVAGWVRLGDTRIDYPILQGDDNDYYMLHDIDGNVCLYESCITADYKLIFDGLNISDNMLLYGHNSAKGTYFAPLSNFYRTTLDGSLSYYKKYPVVNIDTLYEESEWKIFATVLMNTQEKFGDVFRFWEYPEFEDEDDFHSYILNVMDRSVLFTDVDIEYGDKIATLSTCLYPYGKEVDTRCVVFARKIRPGESSEVDTDKATRNTGVLRFEYEARVLGDSWNGRVWDVKKYLPGYKEPENTTDD